MRNITAARAMRWRSLFILITVAPRMSHVHYVTGLSKESEPLDWSVEKEMNKKRAISLWLVALFA